MNAGLVLAGILAFPVLIVVGVLVRVNLGAPVPGARLLVFRRAQSMVMLSARSAVGIYVMKINAGPGAVVNRDLPPHCTAVGVPAKPIKFHIDHQSGPAGALDQG